MILVIPEQIVVFKQQFLLKSAVYRQHFLQINLIFAHLLPHPSADFIHHIDGGTKIIGLLLA